MTTPSTSKELLAMVNRLPESEQAIFWSMTRKELSKQLATSLDKRPETTMKKLSMQEIVKEVRAVRKIH